MGSENGWTKLMNLVDLDEFGSDDTLFFADAGFLSIIIELSDTAKIQRAIKWNNRRLYWNKHVERERAPYKNV